MCMNILHGILPTPLVKKDVKLKTPMVLTDNGFILKLFVMLAVPIQELLSLVEQLANILGLFTTKILSHLKIQ